MSLKDNSFKKLRKEKHKWRLDSIEEYEAKEKEILAEMNRNKEPTINTSVRITAGKLKGFNINVPPNTRPLRNKMKVRIFDTLGTDIINKEILDLYAGSGSFGLEAISRGAKFSTFVEISKSAVRVLENNIAKLELKNQLDLVKSKVEMYVSKSKEEKIFDIIFLDPPYKLYNTKNTIKMQNIIEDSSYMLRGIKNRKIKFKGLYIVKHPKRYPIEKISLTKIHLFETLEFGFNNISLFIVN